MKDLTNLNISIFYIRQNIISIETSDTFKNLKRIICFIKLAKSKEKEKEKLIKKMFYKFNEFAADENCC